MSKSRVIRPLGNISLGRSLGLLTVIVAAAVAVGLTPGIARATTYTSFDAGTGQCYVHTTGLKTVTAPSVTLTSHWSVPVPVAAWVKLVDLNGNAVSDWFYQGAARLYAGSTVTYPSFGINTSNPQSVRAVWHVELYYGSSTPFEVDDSIVRSYKSYSDFNMGGLFGIVKTYNGITTSC
jgi:hypothetical protein